MRRPTALVLILLSVQACTWPEGEPEPGLGSPVSWDQLENWEADTHVAVWPALLRSCTRLKDRADWQAVCRAAGEIANPTDAQARIFFETRLLPHPVYGESGDREGLITGYYEPLLQGSFEPSDRYRYPLYAPPDDLLTVDMDGIDPELGDTQLRGRLDGGKVVPYADRAELDAFPGPLSGWELLWVDDPYDAFFLHVQGSGRVSLPDGRIVAVSYADHNGHPYRSIGRRLMEMGELKRQDVNLFSIRRWLREHPDKAKDVLHYNPRYIFFRLRSDAAEGPEGALNVPLTPGRSLAVDKEKLPLGAPVWLETTMPGHPDKPLNRLMMAQDTGGAIRGYNRADVFWGLGDDAEKRAGLMKQQGRMFVLLPR